MAEREWFVTFGSQYPRVPHPTFPGAHRDGYVVIEAETEAEARRVAVEHLRQHWSSLYSKDEWEGADDNAVWYPLGELARWRDRQAAARRELEEIPEEIRTRRFQA